MKHLTLIFSLIFNSLVFSQDKITLEGQVLNKLNTIMVVYALIDTSYQQITSEVIEKDFIIEADIGYSYLVTFVNDTSFKLMWIEAGKTSRQQNITIDFFDKRHIVIYYDEEIDNYQMYFKDDDYVRRYILREEELGKLKL